MNLSGNSVKQFKEYYNVPVQNCLIILDFLHLSFGTLRFRTKGTSGGQKGMAHVIQTLKSENINQLRIGIGVPPEGVTFEDHVLQQWSPNELTKIPNLIHSSRICLEYWLKHGSERTLESIFQLSIGT